MQPEGTEGPALPTARAPGSTRSRGVMVGTGLTRRCLRPQAQCWCWWSAGAPRMVSGSWPQGGGAGVGGAAAGGGLRAFRRPRPELDFASVSWRVGSFPGCMSRSRGAGGCPGSCEGSWSHRCRPPAGEDAGGREAEEQPGGCPAAGPVCSGRTAAPAGGRGAAEPGGGGRGCPEEGEG